VRLVAAYWYGLIGLLGPGEVLADMVVVGLAADNMVVVGPHWLADKVVAVTVETGQHARELAAVAERGV
jgi:hypothetical protein